MLILEQPVWEIHRYIVDAGDRVVDFVENWSTFYRQYGVRDAAGRDAVIGRSSPDFIDGPDIQYVYRVIPEGVRCE